MVPVEIAPRPVFHSIRPMVMSARGLVVAGSPLAAQAGARVMAQGGNAVDAAVAAAAVQAVVMPHMNGLGGDLFFLHVAADGGVRALNASGPAPACASAHAFRARGLKAVPLRGIEAVSVPGAVDGWFRALRELGRLKPADAFQSALEYARDGFPIHKNFVRYLASPAFQSIRKMSPALTATYLKDGQLPEVGTRLVQPQLAKTLERLIRDGPEEFYRGETAELIGHTSARLGGFLSTGDLARYQSHWVTPISVPYRGLTVYQVPPNSQGVTMLQQLRFLGLFDLEALGHNTPDYIHLLVEVKKAAFADRDRWVADPNFATVPVEDLLSLDRATAFRRGFDARTASGAVRVKRQRPGGDTTCLVAIDGQGNVVSLIQSLFWEFGSGVFVERAGFALHNRLCGFTLEPKHPNGLEPGKRPLHTLCCSLVMRDHRLLLAYATPGGHAQTQTLVQILNNLIIFGMDIQEAVEARRFTHEGDQVLLESRFPRATRAALTRRGHAVDFLPAWSSIVGGSAAIAVHPEAGTRLGGADPRRDTYAIPA